MSKQTKDESKPLVEKDLLVKKFGDSLYVPLTKFFKHMNIKESSIVKAKLFNDGKLIIEKSQ